MMTKLQELGYGEELVILAGFLAIIKIITYTSFLDPIPYKWGYPLILIGVSVVLYGIGGAILRRLRPKARKDQIIGGKLTT